MPFCVSSVPADQRIGNQNRIGQTWRLSGTSWRIIPRASRRTTNAPLGAMNAELECIACNVKRVVIQVTLVARGYEMRSLECPECSNLLRLVVRHRRPVLQHVWPSPCRGRQSTTVVPRMSPFLAPTRHAG